VSSGNLAGLQQVVLDHVADDADAVEVASAPLRAEVLLEGDLHRLDVLRRPERLEERVCPPERRNVEQDLLAEVVVDPMGHVSDMSWTCPGQGSSKVVADPIELRLVEVARRERVELLERGGVAAERLLDQQPREAARRRPAVRRHHLCDRAKHGRRH